MVAAPTAARAVGDRGTGRHGQVVDAHEAARARRIEAHQRQHLGANARRQQVDDGLPPVLRELGDRVGRIVGPHPGENIGDLAVRARAEQLGRQVLVELLEDVRLQFGIRVDLPEDLGLLLLGGIFQQVGDLGRFQPPDAAERSAQQRAAGMPDQWLECFPVPETPGPGRVRRPGRPDVQGPEQPRRPAARVHADHHPVTVPPLQLHVGRPDQARGLHVDQPVTEHVALEQNLAGTPLEAPQVQPGAGQPQHLPVEVADLLDGHVDLAAAHRGDQAGHDRVVVAAQPRDHVRQAADGFSAAADERAPEQSDRRSVSCCVPGAGDIGGVVVMAVHSSGFVRQPAERHVPGGRSREGVPAARSLFQAKMNIRWPARAGSHRARFRHIGRVV